MDLLYSHSKPHEKALIALQEKGFNVGVDYFTGALVPFQRKVGEIQKRFWPVTSPIGKKRHAWKKQKSFWHLRQLRKSPPDLTFINMSGHGSAYSFTVGKELRAAGKPYVAMIGGIHMSEHKAAMRYYREAHHLIVHTEIQKKELLANPLFQNLTIEVMPLGIDTTQFCPSKQSKDGKLELLYVGRISRLKQIELAIDTVARYVQKVDTNVRFRIAGPISDEVYFSELKDQIKTNELESYIEILGPVKQELLIPIYQGADLLLLPSAHESFGMVMVEAMACGVPVAALKGAGGPDEIVMHEETGILCSKGRYVKEVVEFAAHTTKLEEAGKAAREFVERKWSINQTIAVMSRSVENACAL